MDPMPIQVIVIMMIDNVHDHDCVGTLSAVALRDRQTPGGSRWMRPKSVFMVRRLLVKLMDADYFFIVFGMEKGIDLLSNDFVFTSIEVPPQHVSII